MSAKNDIVKAAADRFHYGRYLRHVLRRHTGVYVVDVVLRGGEWVATISDTKIGPRPSPETTVTVSDLLLGRYTLPRAGGGDEVPEAKAP